MSINLQPSLEAQVQEIYDNANRLADKIGGVELGMNILLGPPILNPPVMIISLQGAGADTRRQRTWPNKLLYAVPDLDVDPKNNILNPFGARLRKDFESAGLYQLLQEKVVASNIVFPQWPSFDCWCKRGKLASTWNRKSKEWLGELVDIMSPKVILTYGKAAFETLTGEKKKKALPTRGSFCRIPVIGCGHLSRGADLDERRSALRLLISEINP